MFVGGADMLLAVTVGAAQPSTGTGIEQQAIGSVVIGGAPINSGKDAVIGPFSASPLWGVIGNALNHASERYVQDVHLRGADRVRRSRQLAPPPYGKGAHAVVCAAALISRRTARTRRG